MNSLSARGKSATWKNRTTVRPVPQLGWRARHLLAVLAGDFTALEEQVDTICFTFRASLRIDPSSFGSVHDQANVALRGLLPDYRQLLANIEDICTGSRSRASSAGFHLGKVEDVVDQREQLLAAAEDVADETPLLISALSQGDRRRAPPRSR